jgi:hypothetical protein
MRGDRKVRGGPPPPEVPLDPGFTGRDVDVQVRGARGGDRQLGVRAPHHPVGGPQLGEETPVRLGRGTTGEGEVAVLKSVIRSLAEAPPGPHRGSQPGLP